MVTGPSSSNKKAYFKSKGTVSRKYRKNAIRFYPLDPFGNPIVCQPKWMALGEPALTRGEKVAFGHRFPGQLRLWYKESKLILEKEDIGPPLCHYKGLPVSRNDTFVFKMRAFVRATLADCFTKKSSDTNNIVFPYGVNVWEKTMDLNTRKESYYNDFANVQTDVRPAGPRAVIFTAYEKGRPETSIYGNESSDDEESESDSDDETDEFLYSTDSDSVIFTSDEENDENCCKNYKKFGKNDGKFTSGRDVQCDQEHDEGINEPPKNEWAHIAEENVTRKQQVVFESNLYQGNACGSVEYCCWCEECVRTVNMHCRNPRMNKSNTENIARRKGSFSSI